MDITFILKDLIKNIAILLKEYGYTKIGNTFYKQQSGNWAVLSFQKSTANTKDEIRFTMNVGICSHTIRDFFDSEKSKNKPALDECQWQKRIGDFIANGDDLWWSFNASTDVNFLFQEIKQALINEVLPSIDAHLSDMQLLALWTSGKNAGVTDVQRLIFLAILYKKLGKNDQLVLTLQELEQKAEGKPAASSVKVIKRHLLT